MPTLSPKLELDRCPHCSVAKPDLTGQHIFTTRAHDGDHVRTWRTYVCSTCGGVVIAWANKEGYGVQEIFPEAETVEHAIPNVARAYLTQTIQSLHTPAGAVMLAASAVDAMLKQKNYKAGSLYSRIQKAASDHLITQEMATWAHQVRLDANDQRHADQNVTLPSMADAKKCVEFAKSLATFLFVLPSRVERGLAESKPTSGEKSKT